MSPSDPDIRFFRLPRTIDRKPIERFNKVLSGRVLRGCTFACLITTDAELQRLNRTFRGKDYATDVLSFPCRPDTLENLTGACYAGGQTTKDDDLPHGIRAAYLGDVAISWQRARDHAREFGHSVETEIQILLLHGALHLAGMDHETDGGRMSRAETRWRRALGLPAGLIERVSA
jgi:probable rRNA maturation factor